jgi:hypothetical protein
MLERFEPENQTETAVAEAYTGTRSPGDLLGILAGSRLFVSSRAEVAADGQGFEPLLLGKEDAPLVAAFTAPSRALLHRARAEYLLEMDGDAFLRRLPPGYGTVVNPGYEAQFVVDAGAVERWRTGS